MNMATSEEETIIEKLSIALNLVESLKFENDKLKVNLLEAQEEQKHSVAKYEALVQEYEVQACEKTNLEQDHFSVVEQLKSKIDVQKEEIDRLTENTLQPKDIELMQLQVEQEVSEKFAKKIALQEQEIEKFRSNYFQIRKQNELAEADFKARLQIQSTEHQDSVRSYQEQIASLQEKMRGLQNSLLDTNDIERLRKLQRENTELQLKVNNLSNELQEHQAAQEHIKQEFERKERLLQRQIVEHKANEKNVIADKESVQKQLHGLELDLRKSNDQLSVLQEQNHRLTMELERNKARLEESKHQFSIEVSEIKSAHVLKEANYEKTVSSLKTQIKDLEAQLANVRDVNQNLKLKITDSEKQFSEKLALAKETEVSQISRLESDKRNLENTVNQLRQIQSQREAHESHAHQDLHLEITRLKSQIKEHSSKNQEFLNKIQTLESTNQSTQVKIQNYEMQLKQAEKDNLRQETLLSNDKKEKEAYEEEISILQDQLQDAKLQIEKLRELIDKEQSAYQHTLERYKNLLTKERYNFKKHQEKWQQDHEAMANKLKVLTEALERTRDQMKTKVSMYKKKAKKRETQVDELRQSQYTDKVGDELTELLKRQAQFLELIEKEGLFQI